MSARTGLISVVVFATAIGACLVPTAGDLGDVAPDGEGEVVYLADSFGRVVMREAGGSLRIVDALRSRGPGGTSWIGDAGVGLLVGTSPYNDRVIVDRFVLRTGEVTGRFDVVIPGTEPLLGAPAVASLDDGRSAVLARAIVDGAGSRTRLERYVVPNDLAPRALRAIAAWTAVDDGPSWITLTPLAADRLLVSRTSPSPSGVGATARWTLLDGRLREVETITSGDPGSEWLEDCFPELSPVDRSRWATACGLGDERWGIFVIDIARLSTKLIELAPGSAPVGWHGAGDGRVNVVLDGPALVEVDPMSGTWQPRVLREVTVRPPLGVLVAAAKEPSGVTSARFAAGGRFAYVRRDGPEGAAVTVIDTRERTYRTVALKLEGRDPHAYFSGFVAGSSDGRRIYALETNGVRTTLLVLDARNGAVLDGLGLPEGRGTYEVVALTPMR